MLDLCSVVERGPQRCITQPLPSRSARPGHVLGVLIRVQSRWVQVEGAGEDRGNSSLSDRFLPWRGTEPGRCGEEQQFWVGKTCAGACSGKCSFYRPAVHRGGQCDPQVKSPGVCQVWGLGFILQVVASSRGLFQR